MLIMVLNVLCRLFLINKNVLKNEKIEAKSHKPASFSKKSTGQPYGETFRERPSAHLLCNLGKKVPEDFMGCSIFCVLYLKQSNLSEPLLVRDVWF